MTTKTTKYKKRIVSKNKKSKSATKSNSKTLKNKAKKTTTAEKKKKVASVKKTGKSSGKIHTVTKTGKKVIARVTVKSVAGKSGVKKKRSRKIAAGIKSDDKKQTLIIVNGPTAFWTVDGQVLDSLITLKTAFDNMSKRTYDYHAKGESNDFVKWVDLVLKDAECARDLDKARTPKTAAKVTEKHLKLYKF